MVSALSRSVALLFALGLVLASGWALSREYLLSSPGRWGVDYPCICYFPFYEERTFAWDRLDTDLFGIRAPHQTVLRRETRTSGVIEDPRFTLSYALDETAGTQAPSGAKSVYERQTSVDGRPAILRTAYYPGRDRPYFVQIVIPRAVYDGGRWLTLDIHGWATTEESGWFVERMLERIEFSPPFDRPLTPARPHVPQPVIEVEMP